ncbi:MAG: hypothetical protein AB7L84_09820 [Acidimicrobiia bacterium]
MKRTYAGPVTEVDLVLPDGSELHVKRGDVVDVPDDLVLDAVEWPPVTTKPKTTEV